MNRAARTLAIAIGLLIAAGSVIPEAVAEELRRGIVLAQVEGAEQQQRPNVFRFLTRPFRREARQPRNVSPNELAQPPARAQPRPQRRNRPPAEAPAPEVVAVEKTPDAKRVLVIGDFMATSLSKGLTDAYAQNANIVVADASNGSSGLVRKDHYNWPAELPGLVAAQKPEAIVVMIGANDRQTMDSETGSQVLGTEGWRTAYRGRVSALADALRATSRPVLWAGLAPVRPSNMSRDYSAFNGIAREAVEEKGLIFVDTWNGFADEEGRFVGTGPSVNGQVVQLRGSDGINFTRAGQRKLAFFLEQALNDRLGNASPQIAATEPTTEPAEEGPKIGPMVPMDALTVSGSAALSPKRRQLRSRRPAQQ